MKKEKMKPIYKILIVILLISYGYVEWRARYRFADKEMAKTMSYFAKTHPLFFDFDSIIILTIGNTCNYDSLGDLKKLTNLEILYIGYNEDEKDLYDPGVMLTPKRVCKTGMVSERKEKKFEKELGELLSSNKHMMDLYINLEPGRSNITNFDFLSQNNSKNIFVTLNNAQNIDYSTLNNRKDVCKLRLVNCDIEKLNDLTNRTRVDFVFENMVIDKAYDYNAVKMNNLFFKNCTFTVDEPFQNAESVEKIWLENCNGLENASISVMKNLKDVMITDCDITKASQLEGLHHLRTFSVWFNPLNDDKEESEKLQQMYYN